jgi:DNA-binding NarL/FixJ family response regulator
VIRVLLADDQALVRGGLRKIVDTEPDMTVVAEAADGLHAVDAARASRPDVAIVDIRMPHLDGIEATRRIVDALGDSVRVLILTTFGLDEYVFDALRAGASGFMLKDAPPEELLDAVRVVADGAALLAPTVTRSVIDEFARRSPSPRTEQLERLEELTEREREVLMLLTRGGSNSEIAAELIVGDATVKTHVAKILMKLGVRDRVQAVIFAYESGLVAPGTEPAGWGPGDRGYERHDA